MSDTHIINHYIPRFHLRKWESQGGMIYDKETNETRNIRKYDFSEKHYYSLDKSNLLEKRISCFEGYIGNIIIKIDKSKASIQLSKKQFFLLKLYSLLCTYRQENTTEIISSDVFGLYEGNQYRFGSKNLSTIEEVITETDKVVSLFEDVHKMKNYNDELFLDNEIYVNLLMLHLSIIRSNEVEFTISNIFTIIENTLDNEHLYSYTPISPRSAILLVQSLYYIDEQTLEHHKNKLNFMKGKTRPDPYLSAIFCRSICEGKYSEVDLICSHEVNDEDNNNIVVQINHVLDEVAIYLNSIMFEDCQKIVFIKENTLKYAKSIRANFRHITMGPWK